MQKGRVGSLFPPFNCPKKESLLTRETKFHLVRAIASIDAK